MPDPASRLPPRPSLEQLHNQAKDLLKLARAGDDDAIERFRAQGVPPPQAGGLKGPTLAEAQLILAREYGFESWPKLVHYVDAVADSDPSAPFDQLARDLVAVFRSGDPKALRRLNESLGGQFTAEELRARVLDHLSLVPGATASNPEFTLADGRLVVARQFGVESWARLMENVATAPGDARRAPHGLGTTPPFYRIDWKQNVIEPGPLLSNGDWDTVIGVMKEMGITGFNAGGRMTDGGLHRLCQLDQLTHLDLDGSHQITDAGIAHLARLPRLEDLNLNGGKGRISDRGLEVLRQLPGLRRFQACWQQNLSDAGVANLTFCEHLESVDLMGTQTGDGAINALTSKRKLRRFKSGRRVTDAGLPLLHRFPVFKTWQGGEVRYALMEAEAEPNHLMLDGPFTNAGLAALLGLDGVFGLSFFWHASAVTADGLAPLASLPNLGYLGLEGKLCTDEAMRRIATLPRLRMLMAQGAVAGDAGFEALSRSQTIEYLWGRECPNLTGRGFVAMAAMPSLRGVAVSCKRVDDSALACLPSFPALRELMPMDVPDSGFRHVGQCGQLEALWCMYCRDTTDVATAQISGLSRLKTYYAGKTRITDRSLEVLGGMASLESVSLWATAAVTDGGIAALAGLPRLREVRLEGLPLVTREGAGIFPRHVHVHYSS